jgi:hypothetical protein
MGIHVMAEGAVVSCGPVPMRPKPVRGSRGESGGDGMRDHRGGFCEVQWVNSTPLLSSYNRFTYLQVDTIMTPDICNIKSNVGICIADA